MPQNRQVVVFLSHSHIDRHVATVLQSVLQESGATTYLDQDQIQAGDDLPDRIVRDIQSCDVFLLLWSFTAASRPWVRRELETALQHGKRVIPYRIDATPFPSPLSNVVFVT